jgi:hypothetical protein
VESRRAGDMSHVGHALRSHLLLYSSQRHGAGGPPATGRATVATHREKNSQRRRLPFLPTVHALRSRSSPCGSSCPRDGVAGCHVIPAGVVVCP